MMTDDHAPGYGLLRLGAPNPAQGTGKEHRRTVEIGLVGRIVSPAPLAAGGQHRDAADARQKNEDKYGGQQGELLPAAEHGHGDEGHAEPKEDLPQVVRVAAQGPQAALYKGALVVRVAPEGSLLPIRNHFEDEAKKP